MVLRVSQYLVLRGKMDSYRTTNEKLKGKLKESQRQTKESSKRKYNGKLNGRKKDSYRKAKGKLKESSR